MLKKSFIVLIVAVLLAQAAAAQEQTYIVRPGDTLNTIADFFDTTVEALVLANDIPNASRITPGQTLTIPDPTMPLSIPQRTYTVQRGDTLSAIAARNNTTLEALRLYNVIANPDRLTVGEVINLPPIGGPTQTETTTAVIQQPTTTTVTTTVTVPQVQQQTIIRRVVNGYYTVQYGDTLLAISRSFGVDAWNIARANGIYNLNMIYAGQRLIIPGY